MYAVSKEHKGNKLFAKTRRAGIPQKLENLDNNRDSNNKREFNNSPLNDMSGSTNPKPVFHMNGRRSYHQRYQTETISAQHQEIIKYIHENWKCVKRELDSGHRYSLSGDFKNTNSKVPQITYYKGNGSQLPNFEPFDLETFWGQKLFQNITQST